MRKINNDEKYMTLQELLQLEHPETYDFSNDGANHSYNELDNRTDVFEKFFVYMGLAKSYTREEDDIMKAGADYTQECVKRYKKRVEPDSHSELLRVIYTNLWAEDVLKFCTKSNYITGETLNSANTTLIELFRLLETEEEKKERESVKLEKGKQSVSIRYIMSRYAKNPVEFKKCIDGFAGFLSLYHTLGNFMPVPNDCNAPRSNAIIKDYWDLTLYKIYQYYECKIGEDNKEYLCDIVGEKNYCLYKDWLDSFRDDRDDSAWNNFVESNYLQDFVTLSGDNYGMPYELWEGHFTGNPLPTNLIQIEEFSKNASSFILARGKRMIKSLII